MHRGYRVRRGRDTQAVIAAEWRRIKSGGVHHRRLLSRLVLVLIATVIVDLAGTLLMWMFESGKDGSEISGVGDALFFSTVQILTVSSQLKNPVTTPGRVVDVALELWAVVVVAGSAGAFADFFHSQPD